MPPCEGSFREMTGVFARILRRRPAVMITVRTGEMPAGAMVFRKRNTLPPPLADQQPAGRSTVSVSPPMLVTWRVAPKNVGSSEPVRVGPTIAARETSTSFGVGVSRRVSFLPLMGASMAQEEAAASAARAATVRTRVKLDMRDPPWAAPEWPTPGMVGRRAIAYRRPELGA